MIYLFRIKGFCFSSLFSRIEGFAHGCDDVSHHEFPDVHIQQLEHPVHHGPVEEVQTPSLAEGASHCWTVTQSQRSPVIFCSFQTTQRNSLSG